MTLFTTGFLLTMNVDGNPTKELRFETSPLRNRTDER